MDVQRLTESHAVAIATIALRAVDDGAETQPGGQLTDAAAIPVEQAIPPLPSGSIEP